MENSCHVPADNSPRLDASNLTLTDEEFRRIRNLVKSHFGIDLVVEKKPLVVNRLKNFILTNGFPSYRAYIEHVSADKTGNALNTLASLISTNHTSFFREEVHFQFLKCHVLPEIATRLAQQGVHDLRVWCAAASTGQEAYSIMMTMLEFFGASYAKLDAGVLATDLSTRALETAAVGHYTDEQLVNVPMDLRRRYFRKTADDQYQVMTPVRSEVLFRKFNLLDEPYPFKKPFHVIFCRNVMIYFDAETQRRVVQKLYKFTAPGGYLFLGHAETINSDGRLYQYVRPAVYQRPN